ncbi:MAG: hypothetical protein A2934_05350 [Candidatus Sungbacteria bacterium RIFCSPLOWO2_01_FULL_47_10]|uniref:Uncharacterized protein n=1 Tax=Candidatus Sungbacteria bacterium RIFCSPLOWO2_01_FULL_47_10 TaxID=1802276 RepID=A0A1G2L1V7_9BACT|nr:MAG: hypothetical protein A2934_05350 [Candidatus Sungbacteria bacterium RIFCSPLOWO2_01_FULL_47_10]
MYPDLDTDKISRSTDEAATGLTRPEHAEGGLIRENFLDSLRKAQLERKKIKAEEEIKAAERKLAEKQAERVVRIKARQENKTLWAVASLEFFLRKNFDYGEGICYLKCKDESEIQQIKKAARRHSLKWVLVSGAASAALGLLSLGFPVHGEFLRVFFLIAACLPLPVFFRHLGFLARGYYWLKNNCATCIRIYGRHVCNCVSDGRC